MRALRTYKLLRREMTETISTGKYSLSATRSCAYGLWESTRDGVSVRGHSGGGLGFGINTEVNTVWTPGGDQTDWTFVILSNYDPPLAQDFSAVALRFLVKRPCDGPVVPPRAPERFDILQPLRVHPSTHRFRSCSTAAWPSPRPAGLQAGRPPSLGRRE